MRRVMKAELWAVAVVFVAAAQAGAAVFGPLDLVRNSTTAVLQDDFESPGITNAPNNGALAGTWSTNNPNPSNTVQIWDASLAPNIAPKQGSQYVNLHRTANAFTWLVGTLSSPITSGTLDARFKLYVPSSGIGAGIGGVIVLDQTGFQDTISLHVDNTLLVKRYNGTSYVPTGLSFSPNTWQDWSISANLASQTYNLNVGGSSVTGLPFNGSGTFSQLLFAASGNTAQFFVDQVPEPAGLGLIAALGIMLTRSRRRARA